MNTTNNTPGPDPYMPHTVHKKERGSGIGLVVVIAFGGLILVFGLLHLLAASW